MDKGNKKFCSVPFTDLMISLNKTGETRFSPCCYNRSNYTSFKARTIKDALNSKEMKLFRENVYNNKLGLCPENCRFWKTDDKYPNLKPHLNGIQISLGNKCNSKCIFCYQTNPNHKINPLIFEEFKKYYLPGLKRVYLTGGEPLIVAKDMLDFIITNYPKIKLGIVTNGILLDSCYKFRDRFYEISVSINAGSREVYKKITGIDCFDRVVSNISKIKSKGFKGSLRATFILCKENMHDAENFLRLCSKLKIKDCVISTDDTDPFLSIPPLTKKRLKNIADDLNLDCEFRFDKPLNNIKKIKQLIAYFVYYAFRRMRDRHKRGIKLF